MSEVGNVAVDDMKTTIQSFFSGFLFIQGGWTNGEKGDVESTNQ